MKSLQNTLGRAKVGSGGHFAGLNPSSWYTHTPGNPNDRTKETLDLRYP